MKVIYAEQPGTADTDHSIDSSYLPAGAETGLAVYDEKAGDNSAFYAAIRDADVIINSYVFFDKKALDAMDHCKVISFQATGYNEVDLEYAAQRGIAVVSIHDYCTQETAENAVAMMMCLQRNTHRYNKAIQQDLNWNCYLFPGMKRIEEQTMAIIGLGRIGQHVARIVGPGLGMKVIAYDPFLPPEIAEKLGVKLVDLDTALAEGDVVSVHMNLTKDNAYMFNKETFAKMKKKPIFINEGRGQMVREADLAWALDEGLVRAAGVDMLESEYPVLESCPLVGRENVIMNPHSGYWSDTSDYLVRKYSMENAVNYYEGRLDEVHDIRNGVGVK